MTTINFKENTSVVIDVLNNESLSQFGLPQNLIEILQEEDETVNVELKVTDDQGATPRLLDIRIFDPLNIVIDPDDIHINKDGWSNWFNGSIL